MNTHRHRRGFLRDLLKNLASLKLTVVLLVLSMLLVFFGTLAQINGGMWEMMTAYFHSWIVWCEFDLIAQAIKHNHQPGTLKRIVGIPLPGGYLLGIMLLVNLLAAHATRWRFNIKRIGIILIHFSILLFLVGEAVTSICKTEGVMQIVEGSKQRTYSDRRYVELVITQEQSNNTDATQQVFIIPQNKLTSGQKNLSIPNLPFEIVMHAYYKNSELGGLNQIHQGFIGIGQRIRAIGKAIHSGASGGGVNIPSAIISIRDKTNNNNNNNKEIANKKILLTAIYGDLKQDFIINNKSYAVRLRFKKYQLPYAMRLKDFRFDRYPGTGMSKNFQSDLVIIDPKAGNQSVTIKMNSPLRYKGLTFYQSGFDQGQEKRTSLQVVKDPTGKYYIPEIACGIATLGLFWHFVAMLLAYLARVRKREEKSKLLATQNLTSLKPSTIGQKLKAMRPGLILPALVSVMLLYPLLIGSSVVKGEFDYSGFGRIPIQQGGRIKPISTLARDSLLMLQHRESLSVYRVDQHTVKDWQKLTQALKNQNPDPVIAYLRTAADQRLNAIQTELAHLETQAKTIADWVSSVFQKSSNTAAQNRTAEAQSLHQMLGNQRTILILERRDLISYQGALAQLTQNKETKPDAKTMRYFLGGLNILVHNPQFYKQQVWKKINLSEELKYHVNELSKLSLTDRAKTHLNLLAAAAPEVFAEPEKVKITPSQWLLDVNMHQAYGYQYPVIRIDSPHLIQALGWEHNNQKYFSYIQIIQRITRINKQLHIIRLASQSKTDSGIPDEKQFVSLSNKIKAFRKVFLAGQGIGLSPDTLNASDVWINYRDGSGKENQVLTYYQDLSGGYEQGDAKKFNQVIKDITDYFHGQGSHGAIENTVYDKVITEDAYTAYAPLFRAELVYLAVVLLIIITWVMGQNSTKKQALYNSAIGLLFVGFVVHTLGLAVRMYLSGRPPVIGLYSSAIFVGWIAVLIAFFVEYLLPKRNVIIVSAIVAAATLQVAKILEFDAMPSDTLKPLVAVLDTNFWLATHVTIITIGYAAALVAGVLGAFYVVRSSVLNSLNKTEQKTAIATIYGVVCFSLICSFIGTVLGGIWAAESWGRFWGWDTKENGALLIVIWNAVILHARWAGLVRTRGIAVLSVIGAMVVAFSWFGTNMLGVGLHSYGFVKSGDKYLGAFWCIMMLFVLLGSVLKDKTKQEENHEPNK